MWFLTGTDKNEELDFDTVLKQWNSKWKLINIMLIAAFIIDIIALFIYIIGFSSFDTFLNSSIAARSRWLEELHAPFFNIISIFMLFTITLFWLTYKMMWLLFGAVAIGIVMCIMFNSFDAGRKLVLINTIPYENLKFKHRKELDTLLQRQSESEKNQMSKLLGVIVEKPKEEEEEDDEK
jgi:hypothetical protein